MNALRKAIFPLGLAALVAVVGYKVYRHEAVASRAPMSGTVEATEAALGFQVAGRIATIAPREGDAVRAGEELAVLDRDELDARRMQSQWQLSAARAELAEIDSGSRNNDLARTRDARRATVSRAEAALRSADAGVRNATIKAPFAGVVAVRDRQPGETVAAGAPVLTVVDLSDRWIRIYVPEKQIGAVRLGQAATISSDSYENKTYSGAVMSIASQPEFTPRNVHTQQDDPKLAYAVKIRILGDPTIDLKPGMPADVKLR